MPRLSSRLVLAVALTALLFVGSATAASLTMRGSGFTPSSNGTSAGGGGSSGGGHQSIMNDDDYHPTPPQAKDPGVKLNLNTTAKNSSDGLRARDPGKNVAILTAKDGLLPGGFVIIDHHKKTDFLVVKDAHGHQIAMWLRDFGPEHIGRLNDYLEFLKQQEEDKNLPDCKPDTPYGTPCAPRDCWQEDLFGLPCPR